MGQCQSKLFPADSGIAIGNGLQGEDLFRVHHPMRSLCHQASATAHDTIRASPDDYGVCCCSKACKSSPRF